MTNDPKWGRQEVREHLRKVREFHNADPNKMFPLRELVEMLESYDEVHPITQEQAEVVAYEIKSAVSELIRLQAEKN